MAAPVLKLNVTDLSNQLNAAVMQNSSQTGPNGLATGINSAFTNWFRSNLFPILIAVAVFITVLFVFYGSFLYFTAYGDENRATTAKKTITYAFVGFFIAAVALGIVNYAKRIIIRDEYEKAQLNQTGAVPGPAGGAGGNTGIIGTQPNQAGQVLPNQPNPDTNTDYNFITQ